MNLWLPGDPIDQAPKVNRLLNKPSTLQPHHVMKLWRNKPLIFLRDAFDTPLILDDWQMEAFEQYLIKSRIGMIANKGPGKTFTLACMGWHFFITNLMPKLAALAISKDHLKANLWAELASLHAQSDLLKLSVEPGAERFALKGHELYSFIDARSYPKSADAKQMQSTLAGLHAPNVGFLMDEVGLMPDGIIMTADNALSGGDGDGMMKRIMAAGNPEVASGILYKASKGQTEQEWAIIRVTGDPDNPKRSSRVDIKWAREMIKTFGRDDPYVQINVLGEFPNVPLQTLLSDDEVQKSMARNYSDTEVRNSQHRLGVDVARGGIDRSAFARRRGLRGYPIERFPSTLDGPELAGQIKFRWTDLQIERVYVDNTGGYGGSVIDSCKLDRNMEVRPVVYNAKAQDERYFNKRTEMYFRCRDWVKAGGQLPNDPHLAEELTQLRVIYHAGKWRLEDKEEFKKRIGRSPDSADAFVQTFADVDETSFYAIPTRPLDEQGNPRQWTDEEKWAWAQKQKQSKQDSYLSDQSHIDNDYRPPSNYSA